MSDTTKAVNLSSNIWDIANLLWGDFKHTDFARIIIPFMLLRRLECVLEPTKEKVISTFEEQQGKDTDLSLILPLVSGNKFYNTSRYNLGTLGSTNTKDNLAEYISHFSPNVSVVFEEFGFLNTIEELHKAKLLYGVIQRFAQLDLSKGVVSDRDISNAYEELIKRFAASINEKAGEFMTPKDVVRLTTKLVLNSDEDIFGDTGVIKTVYDPTCGLLGFISDAMEVVHNWNPNAKVIPYGQELDPKTHAMALTSMLIQGFDGKNVVQGSTLSEDKLADKRFNYGLANPPFGIKWEKDREAVEKEHKGLGYDGRFGPGLPRISDGSMLFLMHLVSKMETPEKGGGRVGIVLSGSPLFTGDAGSGESEIRRWLLEEDFVEAIIALPGDMFFNTGIGTYIWILTNKKSDERKGKVQLLNLVDTYTQMRKSEGTKRRYISDEQIDDIARLYENFVESKNCLIMDTTAFGYRKVAIKQALRGYLLINDESLEVVRAGKRFSKLDEDQQSEWINLFKAYAGKQKYGLIADIAKANNGKGNFGKIGAPVIKEITETLFVKDREADVILDAKGNPMVDTSMNDSERVPYGKDVEEYFREEVAPHAPDASIDYSVRDKKDGKVGIVGYEINFNRYFYEYTPPRPLKEIDQDLMRIAASIQKQIQEMAV